MTGNHSRRGSRAAFTLIELLVVVAIIAILVSLTASAVMAVLNKIPETQTSTDIAQLGTAMGNFMAAYRLDSPPPSVLVLREDMSYSPGDPSGDFLKKMFNKNLGAQGVVDWNGDGKANGPWTLEGEQCLVFYLGGIPTMASGSPGCQGFSTNNLNPAQPGGNRNGPYFEFKSTRLVPLSNGFFVFMDPWQAKPTPQPYAYFSSRGLNNSGYLSNGLKDCQTIGALPYWTAQNAQGVPTQFTNSNTYQIICAGKNGQFGGGLWAPSNGATGAGADDWSNFSSRVLAAGQQ